MNTVFVRPCMVCVHYMRQSVGTERYGIMREELERTELLIGEEALLKLEDAHVAVFGVGGVGGFAVEALARAGVGELTIIDHDMVSVSNINRQIIATHSTIGQKKVDAMEARIKSISNVCKVNALDCFYLPETAEDFDFSRYDYVIDAIDTVTAKIDIIVQCKKAGTKVISSMGTGNKLNPMLFRIDDIYKTSVCPLAKVMRKELRKRAIDSVKVLYSTEEPIKPANAQKVTNPEDAQAIRKKTVPGSISFTPSVAGLLIASEVIKEIACI